MENQSLSLLSNLSVAGTSFILIVLAELGDKSQLVCMTLAARHRHGPVLLGAVVAFAILNLLAVLFGGLVAAWIPEFWLAIIVAALFAFFGLQSLLASDDPEAAESSVRSNHSLFISAFLMIFVAEFGDKTQLAVAGLASSYQGVPVWLGATLALFVTTGIAVYVGQRFMKRLPLGLIHKFSGILFLLLAAAALYQAFFA
ncbi:MAG: TMEM165/GDT1 family protein [Pseudomonadales bacterium]